MFTILFCLGVYGIYRGASRLCKVVKSNPAGITQWAMLARSVLSR